MQVAFGFIAVVFGLLVAAMLLAVVLVPLFRGIGWLVRHLFAFVGGEIKDTLRVVGAVITALVFSLLVVGNILIFRWSASSHFGRAFSAEISAGASSIYRIFVGHPARLLGLKSLVDGIENRVPQAVAAAPTRDKPSRRTGQFEHYKIVGSLPGGGSGGKLYVAEPDDIKLASFARNGHGDIGQVVVKSFSLKDGSSLPQIVRESRSLDAAKKLGLVLDHELTPERFYYVMEYMPGESLGVETQRMHAASPAEGLSDANLRRGLGYVEGLLATLRRYHDGGLWHKDVKPDNIIIHDGDAHLVDFGLITPLRSAMTLTTHGTEYFRDPEMVRMALKGVKVHEVDGARFDVYAAGAVLYSTIENSFPAHGGLSRISKRCPDTLRWIVRRAMTDYDKRYPTAAAMLADVQYVRSAQDPFNVKPAELPSVAGGIAEPNEPVVEVRDEDLAFMPPVQPTNPTKAVPTPGGGPRRAAATMAAAIAAARAKPKLNVTGWWSGKYKLEDDEKLAGKGSRAVAMGLAPKPFVKVGKFGTSVAESLRETDAMLDDAFGEIDAAIDGEAKADQEFFRAAHRAGGAGAAGARRPAAEQLESARARAAARRSSAQERMNRHRHNRSGRKHASGVNFGVAASLFIFLAFGVGLAGLLVTGSLKQNNVSTVQIDGETYVDGVLAQASAVAEAMGDGVSALVNAESPEPIAAPTLRGRVLVVDDLSRPLDSRVSAWLRGGVALMEQAGLEVFSTLSDNQTDAADVNELVARVKVARAQQPLDSGKAREAISNWLHAEDSADVLVWIDPAPAGEGQPAVYVFGSPEALEGAPEGFLPMIERLFSPQG